MRDGRPPGEINLRPSFWMRQPELTQDVLRRLERASARQFANETAWNQHLDALSVTDER